MNNFIYMHLRPNTFQPGFGTNHISKNFIPDYFFKSMYQTRKLNPEAKIYLITDDEVSKDLQDAIGITTVPFSSADFQNVRLLNDVMKFKSQIGYDYNPFWVIAFIRYMLCEYICDKFGIDRFCFIEGDNLIYFNIDGIIDKYCRDSLAVCNETSPGNYCSGIYFCTNVSLLKKMNDFNLHKLEMGNRGFTDMNCLYHFNKYESPITLLPGLPQDTEDNLLFDMSSYGQFLGGENHQRKDSFLDHSHRLYKELFAKYENGKDFQIFQNDAFFKLRFFDKTYDLFNIHAHNKANFDKFFIYNGQFKAEVEI